MKRFILVILFLNLYVTTLFSQSNSKSTFTVKAQSGENVVYKSANAVGLTFHTRGWGINYIHLKELQNNKLFYLNFQLYSMKHPKEAKIRREGAALSTRSIIYGKKYALTNFRTSLGFRKNLFEKRRVNGVSIDLIYDIGVSFMLAKPVYLKVYKNDPQTGQVYVDTEAYDETKHDLTNIEGRAGMFEGLSSAKIYPGLSAKFGGYADWSDQTDLMRGIELGIALDLYPEKIEIMAYNPAEFYFLTLYANIQIGKKSYY